MFAVMLLPQNDETAAEILTQTGYNGDLGLHGQSYHIRFIKCKVVFGILPTLGRRHDDCFLSIVVAVHQHIQQRLS